NTKKIMSENKNPKFKVSPWLVYGLIIGILLLINVFGNGIDFSNPKPATLSKFYDFLDSNQVEKVIFSNTKAQIYLKKEALGNKEHANAKDNMLGKLNEKGPHYFVEIGNLELFQKNLAEAHKKGLLDDYSKEPDGIWGEVFSILLPFIL